MRQSSLNWLPGRPGQPKNISGQQEFSPLVVRGQPQKIWHKYSTHFLHCKLVCVPSDEHSFTRNKERIPRFNLWISARFCNTNVHTCTLCTYSVVRFPDRTCRFTNAWFVCGLAQRAQAALYPRRVYAAQFLKNYLIWFLHSTGHGENMIWFLHSAGQWEKARRGGSTYSVGIARADVRSPYVSYPCTCTYTPIPVCGEICVWRTYCFSVKCLRICDLNDLISSLSAEHVGFCGLFFLSGFGHLPTRLCCLMINSMIFLHMTIVLNFCKLFKILVFFKFCLCVL